MGRPNITDHVAHGSIVLDRLKDEAPASLKRHIKYFEKEHLILCAAAKRVELQREARDEALKAIGGADTELDGTLDVVADRVVGAGLGTRARPLARFTKYSVSEVQRLPYATELKEVRLIVAKLTRAKPPATVKAALRDTAAKSTTVEKALKAFTKPEATYHKSVKARDALLPAWDKAYRKLKLQAEAAWVDDPATFESMFAEVAAVQHPVKKRSKKKPAATPVVAAK